ncbi:hypothetical protein CPT_Moabite_309 [Serratia phage Moabite]|uniref:Uncharacterized protein n=1 Tax=Serratia phage Moabite TaxID=2587814 RepID=A0A4Y5TQV8_9CAUD|nr:hypothetical protein HWC48_gp107 [Serratia phage Moabite]QDB71339.1 hypothetical protein CPT_Moabite_309 [Serratia phage Moabite]UGO54191.1 hypothetical protein HAYMO_209 [Serratia phage vB_SmaM_Haymo]UQT03697.1 hypothetical protein KODAMA_02300 [Serratia phage vB_SmaM-Kodama]
MFNKLKSHPIVNRIKAIAQKVPVIKVEIMTISENDSALQVEVKQTLNFGLSVIMTIALLVTLANLIAVTWPILAFYSVVRLCNRASQAYNNWVAKRKETETQTPEAEPVTA